VVERRAPRKISLGGPDIELLAFLAEHRMALPDHAAALLGRSPDTARVRLARLAEAGFVRSERVFRGQPPMHLITRAGLDVIASSLAPPRIELRTYAHDVGVAWLWLAARGGTFGPLHEVVGERRLRSHDGARSPEVEPLWVRLGGVGPRGRERLHYPDLLLRTADGRRIALELELSSKGRVRLETILAGYGADPRIDGVVYLVERPAIARAVRDAARRLGLSDRVHVQRVRSSVSRPPAERRLGLERAPAVVR
jgi:DNA-binding transcriptional ArsR family regulator